MKIKGPQGTMIDGEAMVLTLIVIIIGMTALQQINHGMKDVLLP
jgi:hypothetical protein